MPFNSTAFYFVIFDCYRIQRKELLIIVLLSLQLHSTRIYHQIKIPRLQITFHNPPLQTLILPLQYIQTIPNPQQPHIQTRHTIHRIQKLNFQLNEPLILFL